ncbi:hypothetical protein F4823DRAFT_600096 [Ustulina deusta]|nr:hypothetical protein F4823DRAFT_600096 [Ustulina deusta]
MAPRRNGPRETSQTTDRITPKRLALEKLHQVRPHMLVDTADYPLLEAFVFNLFEMLYDIRLKTAHDIHLRVRRDTDEVRIDIWMYEPSLPFRSRYFLEATQYFVSKMWHRNSPELPMSFCMHWLLHEARGMNEVVRYYGPETGCFGPFDLFGILRCFERPGLDLGWIQLPGGTGAPDDIRILAAFYRTPQFRYHESYAELLQGED